MVENVVAVVVVDGTAAREVVEAEIWAEALQYPHPTVALVS